MPPPAALLLHEPWLELILSNKKSWELRGSATSRRGLISLARTGSSKLFGEVELIDCFMVAKRDEQGNLVEVAGNEENFLVHHLSKHQVEDLSAIKYQKVFAWVLKDPKRYEKPVPYCHPRGAIIWVRIAEKDQSKGSQSLTLPMKATSKAMPMPKALPKARCLTLPMKKTTSKTMPKAQPKAHCSALKAITK
ncbi:unnamed protein product [Durusdinium trenchii]|uniref:ASCH domain-containing protein n=1 Tax=Durusdinium trenchii TaxID=1381693 RepID=A0ABP0NYU1_9DINO